MNTLTMEKSAAAKLLVPKHDAARHLKLAVERGEQIKDLRIRNGDELDKGRGFKLEWIQDNTDLLTRMFDNVSVADYCNDWVGKIFPEYAEFGNFVEQFYEEVEYRLNRMRSVLKRIEALPEPGPIQTPEGSAIVAAASGAVMSAEPAPAAAAAAPAVEKAAPAPAEKQAKQSNHAAKEKNAMVAPANTKVLFLSHGAHDPAGESIVQFMQQLALPVVTADLNNGLVESLEGRSDMSFVIVMNSPTADQKAAVSDHVMFKLGYCAGKMGLKRMCMMDSAAHAAVSETHGIPHVPVDAGGGWQLHLARQMKRAGLDIDLNKLA
jgi:predicted nucleotide-binding protein